MLGRRINVKLRRQLDRQFTAMYRRHGGQTGAVSHNAMGKKTVHRKGMLNAKKSSVSLKSYRQAWTAFDLMCITRVISTPLAATFESLHRRSRRCHRETLLTPLPSPLHKT